MSSMPQGGGDQKSKKKKKPKKKGATTFAATAEEPTTPAGTRDAPDEPDDKNGVEGEESEGEEDASSPTKPDPPPEPSALANGVPAPAPTTESDDPAARFDALVRDRDALRAEVTQLRQSLEELQSKHTTEIEAVQGELADAQAEKENAEEQYQSLLGKVNTIRSQLGERLKADAEDLAQARTRIEELEEQRSDLQERYTARASEVEELGAQNDDLKSKAAEQSKELSSLRNRLTLAQQNWGREKGELVDQEGYLREEFENAKQAMHDWEVLAMEERTARRDLADRHADLEEQLTTLKEVSDRASAERDTLSQTVDGLQRALSEIQTVRKQELKELVETSQAEQDDLRAQLQSLQTDHAATVASLQTATADLARALPFESEVKEKNLLIGKLRHEAVILNDHLTKALRFLKKGKPEDNVDRHIVTNHFLHFLALDRSDPKKFQVLQLIAALLGWTDEQREQAGLARPGGGVAGGSLRLPGSPLVHRTPSTPALHGTTTTGSEYFGPDGAGVTSPQGRETLAELWQNFLEQEAVATTATTTATKTAKSRQSSQSQNNLPPTPK